MTSYYQSLPLLSSVLWYWQVANCPLNPGPDDVTKCLPCVLVWADVLYFATLGIRVGFHSTDMPCQRTGWSYRGALDCQTSPLPTLIIPLSLRHYPKQPLDVHKASWGLPGIAGYHLAFSELLGPFWWGTTRTESEYRQRKERDFRDKKKKGKIIGKLLSKETRKGLGWWHCNDL